MPDPGLDEVHFQPFGLFGSRDIPDIKEERSDMTDRKLVYSVRASDEAENKAYTIEEPEAFEQWMEREVK